MTERTFHFVFGLREQTEPFHLLHYLCLASCLAVNAPKQIHFHYRQEPFGPWWDRIRSRLTLRPVTTRAEGFAPKRYRDTAEGRLIERLDLTYAHESDFLRMDILLDEGGAYADMDTLFVQRYPDEWFDAEFAIGEENAAFAKGEIIRPTLCNAVMFAQPRSRFAARWRERMTESFDGTWNRHSCVEAARVWQSDRGSVRVLPSAYFYRHGSSIAGLRNVLEESKEMHDDLYSIHLWAHLWWDSTRTDFSGVHAAQIDEHWIRTRDCTLAQLARRFL